MNSLVTVFVTANEVIKQVFPKTCMCWKIWWSVLRRPSKAF